MARLIGAGPQHPPQRWLASAWAVLATALIVAGGLVAVSADSSAADVVSGSTESVASDVESSIVKTADLSGFDAGNIISDLVFYDSSTMTEAQIQTFLESKVGSCRSGYTCLKDYYVDTRSISADAMCSAYSGGSKERASRVIYKVAQACGINPQVILVMLQKEQGLVTSTAPSSWAYRAAMGQGCPDTAACDSQYYGLFNQVYGGAWQLKRYSNPAGTSNYFTWYAPGKTWNVRYSPNASCGSGAVYIKNQATANLYYYTPYQPNAAALAAGYGTGDSCSSYGNRNFYNYFTDWFGSTQTTAAVDPFGGMNTVVSAGKVKVQGWAIDPDTTDPIKVHIYVDGKGTEITADASRPDVGSVYPTYGADHGIDASFTVGAGDHTVCAYGINVSAGKNTLLGCSTATVLSGSPFGGINTVVSAQKVTVQGWAIDPDTKDAIKVHVYVDGVGTEITANASRPDVGRVYPGYGSKHGIDASFTLDGGQHTICAYGINVKSGANSLLGCTTATVASASPFGGMNTVSALGGVTVQGWAIDPNTTDPIKVHVYIDGAGTEITADASRPDVGLAYPKYGSNHGINASFTLSAGNHTVCAYAINEGLGSNTLLGCSTATVASDSPFGGTDVTVSGKSVRLRGWTIDPSTTDPIKVHVYVDGAGAAVTTADVERADVGRAYPAYGSKHGIDTTLTLSAGTHQVCSYAINVGSGSNSLLACQTVTVG